MRNGPRQIKGEDTQELQWWFSIIPGKRNSNPKLSFGMWEGRAFFSPSNGTLHNIWGQAVDMRLDRWVSVMEGRSPAGAFQVQSVTDNHTPLVWQTTLWGNGPEKMDTGKPTPVHRLQNQVMHHRHQPNEHRAVSSLGLSAVKVPGRCWHFLHYT